MSTDGTRLPEDRSALMLDAARNLAPNDRKAMALEFMRNLDPAAKSEVARESGAVPPPGQRAANAIWMIIVITFALVLIGSAASLFFGVLVSSKTTELQILLTIFTAVVGFLAGLLSPSPQRIKRF